MRGERKGNSDGQLCSAPRAPVSTVWPKGEASSQGLPGGSKTPESLRDHGTALWSGHCPKYPSSHLRHAGSGPPSFPPAVAGLGGGSGV